LAFHEKKWLRSKQVNQDNQLFNIRNKTKAQAVFLISFDTLFAHMPSKTPIFLFEKSGVAFALPRQMLNSGKYIWFLRC